MNASRKVKQEVLQKAENNEEKPYLSDCLFVALNRLHRQRHHHLVFDFHLKFI